MADEGDIIVSDDEVLEIDDRFLDGVERRMHESMNVLM